MTEEKGTSNVHFHVEESKEVVFLQGKKSKVSMVATPAIPELSRRMNQKFEARLGCMARQCLDKTT